MDANELRVNRRNTAAYIASNPSSVALVPRTKQKSGTGTRYVEGTPRAAQILRIIDHSSSRGPNPGTVQSSDGQQRRVEAQLLGVYTAIIGLYDVWTDDDDLRWEVAELLPFNQYERRALVVRYGE